MSNEFPAKVSDVFDPSRWRTVSGFDDFQDLTYHRQVERSDDGTVVRDLPTVRIAFNRPEVRNAFRPGTVDELYRAMDHARMTPDVATVLLTGNGPSPKDGGHSFCSGGDQRIRGRDGYRYADGETQETIDPALGDGPVRGFHLRSLHRGRTGADGQHPFHVAGPHAAAAPAG